ncbi:class I SAM-dependent methyltransferase [Halosimplex litoreum]|uniref:Class I SAM-dependent methyltransferase n=1 Tax=Halosimplex litoreum TaxID=1198301 RepID=A0A7T3KVJ7_9EURY|nr:class I SAM-dependent methyltransferase [Halosimplex litoreum]QPV63204.1 class I SAM-dependent methyltransferase [Halosimplex litoreum]
MLRRDIDSRVVPDDRVFDPGSKHGNKAAHIDANVVAVNIELQPIHKGLAYVRADGFPLPFQADTFDYVSCCQVFEYIPQTRAFVAEISRVLKPEGAAFLDLPNRLFPDRPHSPPGYYSLLPRPLGLRLAQSLLDSDQERYYRDYVYNLSPVIARRAVHAHFESVEYVTPRQKVAYRPIFLGDVDDLVYTLGKGTKVFAKLLLLITLLTRFPPAGWLFELLYPHAAYECREPSRGCKR